MLFQNSFYKKRVKCSQTTNEKKIEHLTRQESIQTNMINSLRDRVNELTAELHEQTRRESARAVQKVTTFLCALVKKADRFIVNLTK